MPAAAMAPGAFYEIIGHRSTIGGLAPGPQFDQRAEVDQDAIGLKDVVLTFGFDNSATPGEQQRVQRTGVMFDIDQNVARLEQVISQCCVGWKIACGIDVEVNFDYDNGKILDEGDKPAPRQYVTKGRDLYKSNLNKIKAAEGEVKILITERRITDERGVLNAGGWAIDGDILLNVNAPQFGGAGKSGLAHELGHHCGYSCGDFPDPTTGSIDTKHNKADENIMFPKAGVGAAPDACYCRGVEKIAK